jgi:hypothetical protein
VWACLLRYPRNATFGFGQIIHRRLIDVFKRGYGSCENKENFLGQPLTAECTGTSGCSRHGKVFPRPPTGVANLASYY